jgi:hypothetical protein
VGYWTPVYSWYINSYMYDNHQSYSRNNLLNDSVFNLNMILFFWITRAWEMLLVMPDRKTAYGTDDGSCGLLSRFVSKDVDDLSEGTLYAAKLIQTGTYVYIYICTYMYIYTHTYFSYYNYIYLHDIIYIFIYIYVYLMSH